MMFHVRRTRPMLGAAALASMIALGSSAAMAQPDPTPLGDETGPLGGDTYLDTSSGPGVIFSVDDSWIVAGKPLPDVGTELEAAGFDGAVTLTTFDGQVFTRPCAANGRVDKLLKKTRAVDVSAASFMEAMASHGSLIAQPVVETEMGGLPALQLDVVSRPGKECDPRTAFLWERPIVRDYHLSNGTIARLIAADVADEVVVAVIEAPATTGASPFAFLDKAMELVGTIEITSADGTDAGAAVAAVAADGDAQTEFDVVLAEVGPNKINVIKVVRELTGLGLKDSKDLVDGVPTAIKVRVDRDQAEQMKATLEEQGATVDIR